MNFSTKIISWYQQNYRNLPWRNTNDAYKIWLSEIILQQTRVSQGLPYYINFITAFPTVNDLANADEQQVLKLWQGLGYYSRARNLHFTAKFVVENLNGIFPTISIYHVKLKIKNLHLNSSKEYHFMILIIGRMSMHMKIVLLLQKVQKMS